MPTPLPPMLRGYCLAALPHGGLVPFTALFAAVACAIVLRSAYDLASPIPIGDWREAPRHLLQWCIAIGLTLLFWAALQQFAGTAGVPAPDRFGPWLRISLMAASGVLALRSMLRMIIRFLRAAQPVSSIIPEFVARLPVHQSEPLPPMRHLDAAEPDRRLLAGSNLPGFVIGVASFAIASSGWKMDSLCLLRLPS